MSRRFGAVGAFSLGVTDKITVEGSVDTSKEGEYTLVYSVTNSRGKTQIRWLVATYATSRTARRASPPHTHY